MVAIPALFFLSIAYSIVRYVAFAPKNLESLPVFVVNKGVSMAAALCFAFGFLAALRRSRGATVVTEPAAWFRAGTFGAIWHVPMSLAILRPAYFPEFFRTAAAAGDGAEPRLSFAGETVFLFGGLAAGGLFLLLRPSWTPRFRHLLSIAFLSLLLAHVLAMGWCRGLNINASHAYLPPMWFLSAVGIVLGLVWLVRTRRPLE